LIFRVSIAGATSCRVLLLIFVNVPPASLLFQQNCINQVKLILTKLQNNELAKAVQGRNYADGLITSKLAVEVNIYEKRKRNTPTNYKHEVATSRLPLQI
jgi:hypothetical protein